MSSPETVPETVSKTADEPRAGTVDLDRNLLDRETSPYLRQHRDNPVHWQAWSEAALAKAKEENKPVLLSIGYAACHWCHVMAHESFEDVAVAELMNAHYVNIKVDREERPDLDNVYQSALQLMGEHGGWPLTMFLTPDGEPFWGGTYFPPEPRYGRPSFSQVLQGVSHTFQNEPEKVTENTDRLTAALKKLAAPEGGGSLTMEKLDNAAILMLRLIDPIHGGTHGAPKFPQSTFFHCLWWAYKRTGSAMLREAVLGTMTKICQGGIYDHVGGGLARYATDMHWLVPHFEKMLYDNAQLLDLLADLWAETENPLFATRAKETVDWLLRDMKSSDTGDEWGFVSAYDADSEGVEGKFYVWSEAEIDAVLGDEAPDFKRAYDVTPDGNWEGVTILNRSHAPTLGDPEAERMLADGRQALLEVRNKRVPPGRDDKVLTDWNGLTIAALAKGALIFNEPLWLDAARTAFRFIETHVSKSGRLLHSWCQGRAAHPATLDDHANMIKAALALHAATGDTSYLAQAATWTEAVKLLYRDEDKGGFYLAAKDTGDLIARPKPPHDNATPAGNGIMLANLATLYHLTGNADYRSEADRLIDGLLAKEPQDQIHQPSLLMGFELLEAGVQVVVMGDPDDDRTAALKSAALGTGLGKVILSTHGETADLPEGHPAHGKTAPTSGAAAFVCRAGSCSLPVTTPAALKAALREAA